MIVIMFMSITLKVSVDLSDLQRPARNPVSDKMLECPDMTPSRQGSLSKSPGYQRISPPWPCPGSLSFPLLGTQATKTDKKYRLHLNLAALRNVYFGCIRGLSLMKMAIFHSCWMYGRWFLRFMTGNSQVLLSRRSQYKHKRSSSQHIYNL